MRSVVQLHSVTVSHRDAFALKEISMTVDAGEFVTVIGPNGAGKTTLLRVVNGLQQISGGSVLVMGINLNHHNGAGIRKRIGYVPQIVTVDPRLPISVREVVMMGRYGRIGILREPDGEDRKVVQDVIQLVGTSTLADRPIPQWAIVNLLEGGPTEAEHEQHAIGVRVILARDSRQVVVEILLERVSKGILLNCGCNSIIPDFNRAISGQHFATGVRLESQHCFKQQRVAHF